MKSKCYGGLKWTARESDALRGQLLQGGRARAANEATAPSVVRRELRQVFFLVFGFFFGSPLDGRSRRHGLNGLVALALHLLAGHVVIEVGIERGAVGSRGGVAIGNLGLDDGAHLRVGAVPRPVAKLAALVALVVRSRLALLAGILPGTVARPVSDCSAAVALVVGSGLTLLARLARGAIPRGGRG